jgi:hypothetical protein
MGKGMALAVPKILTSKSALAAEGIGPRIGISARKTGRIWIVGGLERQASFDRVAENVLTVNLVVVRIANPVIGKTGLPHFTAKIVFFGDSMRITAPNELYCPLQRYVSRSKKKMNMVWHDGEFVQKVFTLGAVVLQNCEK